MKNDKYDSVEKLLALQPEQYVEFLKYVIGVIANRNQQLEAIVQEDNEHE